MRTSIEIDDDLMRKAMKANRTKTKRATVEEALRLLIQTSAPAHIHRLRGNARRHRNPEAASKARSPD